MTSDPCQVYWGSHGCKFQAGHEQPCECACCECPGETCEPYCVAKPPYYGVEETKFYGADAIRRGLKLVDAYIQETLDT